MRVLLQLLLLSLCSRAAGAFEGELFMACGAETNFCPVGANASRLRRDEIVIPLEAAKSDSSLLELPEPGPISQSKLVAEVPVTIKSTESVDPLREAPSLTDELHVGADSAPHEDSESAEEEAVVATTTRFFNIFDLNDSNWEDETVEVCNKAGLPNRSQIFCHGRLLETVNLNHLFLGSKTFVDRPIKINHTWPEIMADFDTRFRKQAFYRNVGSAAELGWDFSTRWFKDHSTLLTIETTNIIPVDLNAFLCYNLNLMSFLHGETHNITGERKWLKEFTNFNVSFTEVFFKPEAKGWYDYNFIAPGGRFREFYYWDTYWIVKGLLASGMCKTTRDMLENLGTKIDRDGLITNGGCIYLEGSLLTAMVYECYEVTRDKALVSMMITRLEREFWEKKRNVTIEINGTNHTVFANVPRPESYLDDWPAANILPTKGRKRANVGNHGAGQMRRVALLFFVVYFLARKFANDVADVVKRIFAMMTPLQIRARRCTRHLTAIEDVQLMRTIVGIYNRNFDELLRGANFSQAQLNHIRRVLDGILFARAVSTVLINYDAELSRMYVAGGVKYSTSDVKIRYVYQRIRQIEQFINLNEGNANSRSPAAEAYDPALNVRVLPTHSSASSSASSLYTALSVGSFSSSSASACSLNTALSVGSFSSSSASACSLNTALMWSTASPTSSVSSLLTALLNDSASTLGDDYSEVTDGIWDESVMGEGGERTFASIASHFEPAAHSTMLVDGRGEGDEDIGADEDSDESHYDLMDIEAANPTLNWPDHVE